MAWGMNTQAAYNICVAQADSSMTYVNNVCSHGRKSFVPPLASGFEHVQGMGLTLTIDFEDSDNIPGV